MLPRETGCGAPIKQLEDRVQLTPQMIPKSVNFDVKDSSLFKKFCALPSPEEVRAQAIAQYLAGIRPDERRTLSDDYPHWLPPVTFEDLGLFVKCGTNVRISEAQCLYALSHLLKDHVPVPEVYGWRKYGDQIFIYMGNIQGQTLEKAWNKLEVDDRVSISRELKTIFNNLRRLEQDPADPFVGSIAKGTLYGRVFDTFLYEAGPFDTVKAFHDWYTFLCRTPMADPYSVPIEPFRYGLPDDCAIKFTHGDLHTSNIMITCSKPYRVIALIDWEQSGWFPEYWEARKLEWVYSKCEGWTAEYVPMILSLYASTQDSWGWYMASLGC